MSKHNGTDSLITFPEDWTGLDRLEECWERIIPLIPHEVMVAEIIPCNLRARREISCLVLVQCLGIGRFGVHKSLGEAREISCMVEFFYLLIHLLMHQSSSIKSTLWFQERWLCEGRVSGPVGTPIWP